MSYVKMLKYYLLKHNTETTLINLWHLKGRRSEEVFSVKNITMKRAALKENYRFSTTGRIILNTKNICLP